jgi:branched-chain amino acid transport system permease protein
MLTKSRLVWVGLFALLALFPLVVTTPTWTSIIMFALLYMAITTSWNMFSGYSGYVALGAACFFGTGAYTVALLAKHWNVPASGDLFWLIPLGGILAMIVALPIGLIALRVRRHTFVVITIAIFFVFQLSAINASFTGGTAGLQLPFIPWSFQDFNLPFYYLAFAMVVVATLLSAWVRQTRFGLQLMAIRDDEDRALGLGVKVWAVKLSGFVMSAFVIGCAGGLYAIYQGQIYPQFVFNPLFDISVALMAFLGGFGTLAGPLLGAFVLETMQLWLTENYSSGSLYLIIFGALFLIVIIFMPQGVVVYVKDRVTKREDRERSLLAQNEVQIAGGSQ